MLFLMLKINYCYVNNDIKPMTNRSKCLYDQDIHRSESVWNDRTTPEINCRRPETVVYRTIHSYVLQNFMELPDWGSSS